MKVDDLKHGAFGWRELMTRDPEAATAFYTELFDWETEETTIGDTSYTVLKVDGDRVGGIIGIPPEASEIPTAWSSHVTVDDVDAIAAKVVALGGTLLRPPTDVPGVARFCMFRDPQGAVICAITYVKD